ncbi:hypothetical protein [Apilactobacillus micheneri]|uniref:hypothetical protein n=1 Tax=Apilactobacillus micheneri TaxID=1899430 RepID=UPI00112D1D01|nr:hypothetical protein [Apilactobacillus micheneri]
MFLVKWKRNKDSNPEQAEKSRLKFRKLLIWFISLILVNFVLSAFNGFNGADNGSESTHKSEKHIKKDSKKTKRLSTKQQKYLDDKKSFKKDLQKYTMSSWKNDTFINSIFINDDNYIELDVSADTAKNWSEDKIKARVRSVVNDIKNIYAKHTPYDANFIGDYTVNARPNDYSTRIAWGNFWKNPYLYFEDDK